MGGTAIIFVPLLAFAAASLYIVLVFAAHYFLTLVECTAQGQRTIQWPGDNFFEWLGKPVHLAWLAGLWVFPAVLLSAGVGRATSPYVGLALSAVAFAVLFPFGALSAFIANSVWTPFHPQAIVLLISRPAITLGFYSVGVSACVVGLGGGFLAMFSQDLGYLGAFVGGVLVAVAWFVYACALGRLLFALTYVAPPPRKKRKKKNLKNLSAELAEVEPEVPHWERPKPAWDPDRDEVPYAAHTAEVVTKESVPELVMPKESEMKLLEKEPVPPPTQGVFGADAFLPMGQSETMRNAILLAVMVSLQAGLVRLLIDMAPR